MKYSGRIVQYIRNADKINRANEDIEVFEKWSDIPQRDESIQNAAGFQGT